MIEVILILLSAFVGVVLAELIIIHLKRKQKREHRAIFIARLSHDLTAMRPKVHTFSLNGQYFQILADSIEDAWEQARRIADGRALIKIN